MRYCAARNFVIGDSLNRECYHERGKPGFPEDLHICFAAVKIFFTPESTNGVEDGKTMAKERE